MLLSIIAISILLAVPLYGEAQSDTVSIGALSKIYKPLKFTHDKHMEIESNCSVCHHHSEGDATPACKVCHDPATIYKYKGPDRKTALGLKGAYHVLCVGCHKKSNGPVNCGECHIRKARKE